MSNMLNSWEANAKEARNVRDSSLAKVHPPLGTLPNPVPINPQEVPKCLLTPKERSITEDYDISKLCESLRRRELTSEEVVRAFLRRAAIAQSLTNCITELLWDEAIKRAKYLDSLPEPLGRLHGVPISVKEAHGMRGKTNHASYTAWVGEPSEDNHLNNILWESGCVFYARTTCPQTLMHLECNNNIYGRTLNSWNRCLTSGGSSGGEGALVGLQGSILGVGGDIGGSIRCPAANNGIYGFKPTSKRLPLAGMKCHSAGNNLISPTFGPLCRSREAINLFMKTVLTARPWEQDPSLTRSQWILPRLATPLKIAIEWSDGVVKPHPPVTRALRNVSVACKAAGMTVVDWEPLEHQTGWELTTALYLPDGGQDMIKPLLDSGEPFLPLTNFIRDQPGVRERSIHEIWKLTQERDMYRNAYASHWSKTGARGQEVDVILCPVGPGAAPPHDCSRYWSYTSQWNLLDYPAVVFPVTVVDPSIDQREETYVPQNTEDKYNYELFDPVKYKDAPVGLQLVGRRNCDEKLMVALEEVERAMKGGLLRTTTQK